MTQAGRDMTKTTALDDAHAAMETDPQDDIARLRFYERLADGELFVLLTDDLEGHEITPELFELDEEKYVLVFDREERLSAFVGKAAPYAALPGRAIVGMLAGQRIGLGINLGVAASSILIPSEAVEWLSQTLKTTPETIEARIAEVLAPSMPEKLVKALDIKLASAGGLASQGHLLGFIDTVEGAEHALATAANEALTFSGLDEGEIDVGFFAHREEIARKLSTLGLRFDLPAPEQPQTVTTSAPGSDPDKPPILK